MALASSIILAQQNILITNTASTLEDLGVDPDLIKTADILMITVESPCRFTFGAGVSPTSGVGHYLSEQVDREFSGNTAIRYIEFIRIGGSDIAGFITLARI